MAKTCKFLLKTNNTCVANMCLSNKACAAKYKNGSPKYFYDKEARERRLQNSIDNTIIRNKTKDDLEMEARARARGQAPKKSKHSRPSSH